MADRVWIHWNAGAWLLTSDGMNRLDAVPRIVLRDVRFVIDPVGLALTWASGKRKTHAWAVGEAVCWKADDLNAEGLVWLELAYKPRHGHENFAIRGGGSLEGADFLDADLEIDCYTATARIAGPRYGSTEHRRVQQYGGMR